MNQHIFYLAYDTVKIYQRYTYITDSTLMVELVYYKVFVWTQNTDGLK